MQDKNHAIRQLRQEMGKLAEYSANQDTMLQSELQDKLEVRLLDNISDLIFRRCHASEELNFK